MRKIIVAGNWKMNLDHGEALHLFSEIQKGSSRPDGLESILVFPPFVYLNELVEMNDLDYLRVGAQNISSEIKGAFTGEVSALMLSSMGLEYCLIGHSERRAYFGEDHAILKKKVNVALSSGIHPVFCCGESLEQRESGHHKEIIGAQLNESLFHISADEFRKVIVAYEPVWAIGTGKTASTQQAEEMHRHIRSLIDSRYDSEIAQQTHILYGGSCNASNSGELFSAENVDGGLIGGASLKAEEFLSIVNQING